MSSPIHCIDRNTAGLVAFAVQLPAPPASSFSEQVLSQRQVSRTCESIAQTLPACLAALLRRPRAAAVCCAMSAFSPCTEAEGTPSSETRMARLAPLQLLARRLAFADPFTGPPREFESHLALSGLRKRSRRPAAAQQRPSQRACSRLRSPAQAGRYQALKRGADLNAFKCRLAQFVLGLNAIETVAELHHLLLVHALLFQFVFFAASLAAVPP